VNWERADGQAAWHRVGDVGEATAFVEHLRNAEGVDAPRIFRLEPVAFEWRPYYRAEVGTAPSFTATVVPDPVPAPAPAAGPAPAVEPAPRSPWLAVAPEPAVDEADPGPDAGAEAGDGPTLARRGLFGR